MSKNKSILIKEADDVRAKLKPLEDILSKIAGLPVELTLRNAEKQSYTISFDGDNPDARYKLKAYFGTNAKWGECGYDAGSEASFMYFDVPSGANEDSSGGNYLSPDMKKDNDKIYGELSKNGILVQMGVDVADNKICFTSFMGDKASVEKILGDFGYQQIKDYGVGADSMQYVTYNNGDKKLSVSYCKDTTRLPDSDGVTKTFKQSKTSGKINEDTEPQHFKTLVDINPGKYAKGSKEYDALMWHRENDPYKLTTLPGLKPNIKGISYNEMDDIWDINESMGNRIGIDEGYMIYEPDDDGYFPSKFGIGMKRSEFFAKYPEMKDAKWRKWDELDNTEQNLIKNQLPDGYTWNEDELKNRKYKFSKTGTSSAKATDIDEAKNINGSLEDNLTKYGQDFEMRGDDIYIKDVDMTFTPNGDGTYIVENPAATIDYKADVMGCLVILDLENESDEELNEAMVDSYTEEERKAIVSEYQSMQYDNTTEEAINKLAEKYAYGDVNTIVSVLKRGGIKLQSYKNGSLVDMFPNIKEAGLPKDEAGLIDTNSPQYIEMVNTEYKKLIDQYSAAPTPELLTQLNSREEFLKLPKTEPIKESLTQVEYLRIRREPVARLYEFNASKRLYVLREEKKITTKHIGSVAVQEGKQYLVNMYGVTQLCTYIGKVDENHIFAPVNDPSATISGTTNEFRCNIRPLQESSNEFFAVLVCDDGSENDGKIASRSFADENEYDDSPWRSEHGGWTVVYIGSDKATAEATAGAPINESTDIASEPAEIFIDGYPYYLSKMGDTTHFEMVNSKDSVGIGGICVHHIGEFRGDPMYDDLVKWLKGDEDMNGRQYGKANESTAKKTGVNEQRTFTMIKEDKGKYQRINEQDEIWDINQFKQHLEDEAGNYHMAYPEDKESLLQWLQDNSTKLPYSVNRFQKIISSNSEWHTADEDDVDSMLTAVGTGVNEKKTHKSTAMVINEAKDDDIISTFIDLSAIKDGKRLKGQELVDSVKAESGCTGKQLASVMNAYSKKPDDYDITPEMLNEEAEPKQTMADAIKKAKEIISSGTTAWEDVKTELAKTFTTFQGSELDMAIDKAKQPGSIYDINEGSAYDFGVWAAEFASDREVKEDGIYYMVPSERYDDAKASLYSVLNRGGGMGQLKSIDGDRETDDMISFIFIPSFKDFVPTDESKTSKWSADKLRSAIKENIGWYALDDVNDKQKVLEWFDTNRSNIADFDNLRTKISENNSWCTDDENHVTEMLEGYNAIGSGPEFVANEEVGKMPDGTDKALFVSEKDAISKLGAESAGEDENGQKMYKIDGTKYIIVDGILHALSSGEPDYPIRKTTFKQLNESAGDDETTFNDMDCIVDTESINDVLIKHGVGADEIDHYSSDLFRIPSKYVTSDLIDELFAIGVKQA